jgi:hypothetical protein
LENDGRPNIVGVLIDAGHLSVEPAAE